jgi:hypothetical protein
VSPDVDRCGRSRMLRRHPLNDLMCFCLSAPCRYPSETPTFAARSYSIYRNNSRHNVDSFDEAFTTSYSQPWLYICPPKPRSFKYVINSNIVVVIEYFRLHFLFDLWLTTTSDMTGFFTNYISCRVVVASHTFAMTPR